MLFGTAINNAGEIVGWGVHKGNGEIHAFRLTPSRTADSSWPALRSSSGHMERGSMQFNAAARATHDRRQGRRRPLPDLETKSKLGEHLLDTFGVGMLSNKIEERSS